MEELWFEFLGRLIDWRALVEIGVIGIGLYFLYRSLDAMGAWKTVVGILVAVGVFAAARLLHLQGIQWILSHVTGVALLALIVLFAPELRRILDRATTFKRRDYASRRPQLAALIADVLFELVRRKWGAILVLSGREAISAATSSGIPIDALPSFPLMISIFDPNSPGHDGAVVIDRGKLTTFGVRLPLSDAGGLPDTFGTRHHAALGLSRVTDALVLVVSEERQAISAFTRSAYRPLGSREQVSGEIERHWRQVQGPSAVASWRSRLRLVSAPLIGSLLVAAVFWLSIVPGLSERLEVTLQVPLEYTSAPRKTALVGERVNHARLLISGTTDDLERAYSSQLRVRVDLSTIVPGRQTLPLTGSSIELPRGVRLEAIEPASLVLDVVALVERELPIRPQLIGEPPAGLHVVAVSVRPATVRALVPENGTDPPIEVLTAPIDLTGISAPTPVARLIVAPRGFRPANGDWPTVVVDLVVR